jgi:hypothetical protein
VLGHQSVNHQYDLAAGRQQQHSLGIGTQSTIVLIQQPVQSCNSMGKWEHSWQKADHNSFVEYDDDEQDEDMADHVMYNPVGQQEQPVVEEQVVDCFDANRKCAQQGLAGV